MCKVYFKLFWNETQIVMKILTVAVGKCLSQHRNSGEHSSFQMIKFFTQTHETKIHSKETILLNKLLITL
jgi:hypothetical protein